MDATPNDHPDAELAARLDPVLDRAVDRGGIVGAVVMAARGGRVVYRRAAGWADREAGRAMRTDALFLLSSVTKPAVALAALSLAESGRLALDEPVTRWLPEFRPRLPGGDAPAICARQLLLHTAGLAYPGSLEHGAPYRAAGVSNGLDGEFTTLAENLRRIASVPLVARPGERWIYSLATDVLGAVVEGVTGESLDRALRRLVLEPLGMADSGFAVADPARRVTHYADGPAGGAGPIVMPARHPIVFEDGGTFEFAPGRIDAPAAYPSGGGGMAGSAGDVLRLLEAIRTGHPGVLSADGAARMREDRVGAAAETHAPGWGFGYAGAVLVDPTADDTPQSPGTVTWGGVYGHTWFIDPTRELTVLTMTNTAVEGLFGPFPIEVRNAVYAA